MVLKKVINDILDIIIMTFNEWIDDKAFRMAAALSFYSLISIAPFMLIITAAAGFIFGQTAATGKIVTSIDDYVGLQSAELIQSLILNAYVPESEMIAAVLGFIVFIWAALAVFVEIRESLNTIWGIEVKPGKGLLEFLTGRLFSLLILLLIGLIFILSLIAGTLLNMADAFFADLFGEIIPFLQWVDTIVSFTIVTLLFVAIIKYLPSVKIEWVYAFIGAIIGSVLFNLGSNIIGYYLNKTNYSFVYGAAGSLVILLLWIYYSSLIFFFCAELTQVIRKKFSDKPLILDDNVLNITKVAEQVQGK
jgi:membrane protein